MHEYYAQENGKIYYAITSRDARENDATQTSEVCTYQIIRQVPVAMLGLQQVFEVMSARFHAVTRTFAPLIDSVVDDNLLQTGPLGNQTSLQIVPIESKRKIGKNNITP